MRIYSSVFHEETSERLDFDQGSFKPVVVVVNVIRLPQSFLASEAKPGRLFKKFVENEIDGATSFFKWKPYFSFKLSIFPPPNKNFRFKGMKDA